MLQGPGAAEQFLCTAWVTVLILLVKTCVKLRIGTYPPTAGVLKSKKPHTESQGEEPKAPVLQGEAETPHSRLERLAGTLGSFCGPQGDGPVAPAVQPDVDKD